MKSLYRKLPPNVATKLRNILEFNGGVTDSFVAPASSYIDIWNPLTQGTSKKYRFPPGSQPQAKIPYAPSWGMNAKRFVNTYLGRDTKRNPLPIQRDQTVSLFSEMDKKLIDLPPPVADIGSPGQKNVDTERYDPVGLRNTMTSTWPAMFATLARHRATHLPEAKKEMKYDVVVNDMLIKKGIKVNNPTRAGPRLTYSQQDDLW